MPFLDEGQARLLSTELAEQQAASATASWQSLPSGPAHCDLFRDNVLFAGTFDDPLMGGFIDFYFAGCDTWLFDVAVSVNDWCIERDTGAFIPELVQSWLRAYAEVRPFTDAERQAWPLMLRGAVLRFWLSRLYDYFLPRPAQTLKPHDPAISKECCKRATSRACRSCNNRAPIMVGTARSLSRDHPTDHTMQAAYLPASSGWQWVRDGFRLFRKQPLAMFLWAMAISLLVIFATAIPPVGRSCSWRSCPSSR